MEVGDKFEKLTAIMARLRGPNGCPWDREQTHASLRQYLLEETYEVLESLDRQRFEELRLELGDLLLQVIFHAQLAAEAGRFTITEVIDAISDKMLRRHPHVFGGAKVSSAQEQTVLWERIKQKEGKRSALDGVPAALPALQRATRLQQKAMSTGFRWQSEEEVWAKFHEELKEFAEARARGNSRDVEDEIGDVFFVMAHLAYYAHVNPEDALRSACEKFTRRFQKMEKVFSDQGRGLQEATIEEMEQVWQVIKQEA